MRMITIQGHHHTLNDIGIAAGSPIEAIKIHDLFRKKALGQ